MNGKINKIKFADKLSKLYQDVFPTIRDDTDLTKGETVEVMVQDKCWGKATLVEKTECKIKEIPTSFLGRDTDTISEENVREAAIDSLRKYYPDLNEETEVFILIFEWTLPDRPKKQKGM